MGVDIVTTVVSAASSKALITLSDVKLELGITGTTDDTWLTSVIDRASLAAAQYCNRTLVSETVKDQFWPQRDGYPWIIPGGIWPLQLTRWPVSSVSSVVENDVTLTVTTDYLLRSAEGQLVRLDSRAYPKKWPAFTIAVQYVAGYQTIPSDLQDAVIRMVKSRWFMRSRDPLLKQEDVPGVYSAAYWVSTGSEGAITPDVADLLDNYRVPVVFA